MIIRKAEVEDIASVMQIDETVLQTNWHEKLYLESLVLKDTRFLVLDLEGVVIGFLMYRHLGGDLEIIQIALDPKYQKQGLGSLLMDSMMVDAKESEIEFIYLEVHTDNESAYKFYRRYEFETIHRRKNYYGLDQDALVMRKECHYVPTSN